MFQPWFGRRPSALLEGLRLNELLDKHWAGLISPLHLWWGWLVGWAPDYNFLLQGEFFEITVNCTLFFAHTAAAGGARKFSAPGLPVRRLQNHFDIGGHVPTSSLDSDLFCPERGSGRGPEAVRLGSRREGAGSVHL